MASRFPDAGGYLLFYHSLFVPLFEDVRHAGAGFFGCDIVFLTKSVGQGFYGEVALRLRFLPQPCGTFIQGQYLSEIDGLEVLAHNHVLAAHFAQHKVFLYSHNRL